MSPKIKNIIIFVGIGLALVLVYVFLIKGSGEEPSLVTSTGEVGTSGVAGETPAISADFLSTLLNIRGIELDDSIFSDPAFLTLRDSELVLIPEGNEGRVNPFAPIGTDPLP